MFQLTGVPLFSKEGSKTHKPCSNNPKPKDNPHISKQQIGKEIQKMAE
jgi:hypothetical protein